MGWTSSASGARVESPRGVVREGVIVRANYKSVLRDGQTTDGQTSWGTRLFAIWALYRGTTELARAINVIEPSNTPFQDSTGYHHATIRQFDDSTIPPFEYLTIWIQPHESVTFRYSLWSTRPVSFLVSLCTSTVLTSSTNHVLSLFAPGHAAMHYQFSGILNLQP